MKVLDKQESIELCTESGWNAYDLTVDEHIDKDTIKRLGSLGFLTYLGMLSQPFYRIEREHYMIKGLEGSRSIRVAMLNGEEEILERVTELLDEL